jgi:hypothetical protein
MLASSSLSRSRAPARPPVACPHAPLPPTCAGARLAGIFDATNSTRERRRAVVDRAAEVGRAIGETISVVFIESICEDADVLEANMLVRDPSALPYPFESGSHAGEMISPRPNTHRNEAYMLLRDAIPLPPNTLVRDVAPSRGDLPSLPFLKAHLRGVDSDMLASDGIRGTWRDQALLQPTPPLHPRPRFALRPTSTA